MRKLILISAALTGALAVGAITWAISSTSSHPQTAHSPTTSSQGGEELSDLAVYRGTDAKIEITSNLAHHHNDAYVVRIDCAFTSASEAFLTTACRETAASPRAFTATYVNAACIGGLTTINLHITGQVNGKRVDIRQFGMCGPASIWRWWHLLYHYRSSLDLPDWVVRGQL